MRQPDKADVEAVRAYLLERIDYERAMDNVLERAMVEAAERIVNILYSANIPPRTVSYGDLPVRVQWDIDAVVQWLEETIYDYFTTFAIAEHEENRDAILPFILGENHGKNFDERLGDYCGNYREELLTLIGAGLILGIGEMALAKSISENLRHPYANPLLAAGIDAPISYGRGRSNSMYNAIGSLTRFGIAQGWMKNLYIDNRNNGCIGWQVRRGSSYPCEICDSFVGFHTDEGDLPPYHGNCRCFAVPIYMK